MDRGRGGLPGPARLVPEESRAIRPDRVHGLARKVAQPTLVPNAVADEASQVIAEAVDRGWSPSYEFPWTFSRTGEVRIYEP